MSIEIWQFPKLATRDQLIDHLKKLGFIREENLYWPGPPGTVSLFWVEPDDHISTSGVDASVLPLDDDGKAAWNTTNDWALRTRTSVWASTFDQKHQNRTVRSIRKSFGGGFYNDHFGHNRYIKIEEYESTPVSRGMYALVSRLSNELDSLEFALPEEKVHSLLTPMGEIFPADDSTGILKHSMELDPSRVVYNALVPFLVAALECFFREAFEILLKYDADAQSKLEEKNRKVPFADARAIANGELTLERVVSGWFSFQNVDSIHTAFKEIHNIDLWNTLRRRKKVRDRLPLLMKALQNLIGARHGVVHRFSLDRRLNREGFLDLLESVRAIIGEMSEAIEKKLGIPFGPG